MSNSDAMKGPAPLTAALLARKGGAAPAGFTPRAIEGGAAKSGTGHPHARDDARTRNDVPRAGVLMRRDDMARRGGDAGDGSGPGTMASRARVTLRLDEARHLRLKLAAAHMQQSLQEILTAALDRYLDDVAPEVLRDDCVCLAVARTQNTEEQR